MLEERSAREGQFAVGEALVAETMPVLARHYALGVVQAFSAVANMIRRVGGNVSGPDPADHAIHSAWRCEFLVGALALMIFKKLKEPEQWLRARAEDRRMGSFADLFPTRGRSHSPIGRIDQASN